MQQKTLRTDVSAGLHKAMSTGKLYKFSDDYGQNIELRFRALETWIDNHCDLVASPDILKVEQPSDSQKGQLWSRVKNMKIFKCDGMIMVEDFTFEKKKNSIFSLYFAHLFVPL